MIASSESMIVSHGSDGLTYTFKICICSHELLGVHFAQHQESNSHEVWKIKPFPCFPIDGRLSVFLK